MGGPRELIPFNRTRERLQCPIENADACMRFGNLDRVAEEEILDQTLDQLRELDSEDFLSYIEENSDYFSNSLKIRIIEQVLLRKPNVVSAVIKRLTPIIIEDRSSTWALRHMARIHGIKLIRELEFSDQDSIPGVRDCFRKEYTLSDLDHLDPSSMVAQNDCRTVVLEPGGRVLSIPGIVAGDAFRKITGRRHSHPSFTIYLGDEHAHIHFADGLHMGFYPSSYPPSFFGTTSKCVVRSDLSRKFNADLKNHLRLNVYASEEQVRAMKEYVQKSEADCDSDSMKYGLLRSNCIDWVQSVMEASKTKADFRNAFLRRQLHSRDGAAPFYSVLRSSGPERSFSDWTADSWSEMGVEAITPRVIAGVAASTVIGMVVATWKTCKLGCRALRAVGRGVGPALGSIRSLCGKRPIK
ncbi:MAG TPA: hypothetical protein VLF94_06630 [Chlamydiales bacterium]|nr:hypothetical protein [Chlamydiales bacterium]